MRSRHSQRKAKHVCGPPKACASFRTATFQNWKRRCSRFLVVREPEEFLYRLMRDYPERGGKRFRPVLVLLACQACGGDAKKAMRTAVAFEMFQSFAVVHDDIEDDSEMRRGKPCLHKLHGIPLTINVGDALYAKVFEILSANREVLGADVALDLMDEMIRGACETFEGQAYDVGWIRQRYIPSEGEFMAMLRKKTGWYTGRGPCTAGAIIAGAKMELRTCIGDFGESMAIAFQLRDDLLNLSSSEQDAGSAPGVTSGAYGKERGGDIAEGKRTLIIIDLLGKCTAAEREEGAGDLTSRAAPQHSRRDRAGYRLSRALRMRPLCRVHVPAEGRRELDTPRKAPGQLPLAILLGEMLSFLVQRAF